MVRSQVRGMVERIRCKFCCHTVCARVRSELSTSLFEVDHSLRQGCNAHHLRQDTFVLQHWCESTVLACLVRGNCSGIWTLVVDSVRYNTSIQLIGGWLDRA